MDFFQFASENREALKILYAVLVICITSLLTIRAHKLFAISAHQGIRYFRNAFFFYTIAFIARYIVSLGTTTLRLVNPLFDFFVVTAGFFLLYSLIYRKFQPENEPLTSSLWDTRMVLFYAVAAVITIADYILGELYFMFASQIIVFLAAFILSVKNYKKIKERRFPNSTHSPWPLVLLHGFSMQLWCIALTISVS